MENCNLNAVLDLLGNTFEATGTKSVLLFFYFLKQYHENGRAVSRQQTAKINALHRRKPDIKTARKCPGGDQLEGFVHGGLPIDESALQLYLGGRLKIVTTDPSTRCQTKNGKRCNTARQILRCMTG